MSDSAIRVMTRFRVDGSNPGILGIQASSHRTQRGRRAHRLPIPDSSRERDWLTKHRYFWLDSVPDIRMRAGDRAVVASRSFFSYEGTGTFVNDLPLMAATGATFVCWGCRACRARTNLANPLILHPPLLQQRLQAELRVPR